MSNGKRGKNSQQNNLEQAKPIRDLDKTNRKQNYASDNTHRISGRIEVFPLEVKFIEELVQESIRNNKGNDTREDQRFVWEKVAVIVAGLLAALTLAQAYLTRQAIKEQHREFLLDQRPYVKVDDLWFSDFETRKKIPELVQGKPIVVNLPYRNIGKSVATSLTIERIVGFGPQFLALKPEKPTPLKGNSNLMPTEGGLTSAVSRKDFYNQSAGVPEGNELNWVGAQPIRLFAHFHYGDNFGNLYCTPILLEYKGNGSWQNLVISDNTSCVDRPNED